MSSTAAAELLGINNISDYDETVKRAIAVLGELYNSAKTGQPPHGFNKTVSGSNLEGTLVALRVLQREGTGGSAYRYDKGHGLRMSNHSARSENFRGNGEHLSIALFERGTMNEFIDDDSTNVIEAVFRKRYLDNNPESLMNLIHDIAHFIAKGEYHDTAGAMKYNYSGSKQFKSEAAKRMEADKKSANTR